MHHLKRDRVNFAIHQCAETVIRVNRTEIGHDGFGQTTGSQRRIDIAFGQTDRGAVEIRVIIRRRQRAIGLHDQPVHNFIERIREQQILATLRCRGCQRLGLVAGGLQPREAPVKRMGRQQRIKVRIPVIHEDDRGVILRLHRIHGRANQLGIDAAAGHVFLGERGVIAASHQTDRDRAAAADIGCGRRGRNAGRRCPAARQAAIGARQAQTHTHRNVVRVAADHTAVCIPDCLIADAAIGRPRNTAERVARLHGICRAGFLCLRARRRSQNQSCSSKM